jgi:hypothetical protein
MIYEDVLERLRSFQIRTLGHGPEVKVVQLVSISLLKSKVFLLEAKTKHSMIW